jgi:hypothetical protein
MSMFPIAPHTLLLALGLMATAQTPPPAVPAPVLSALVEQCVTGVNQFERSATFSAQMTAIPGTQRMAMRIEVQERMPTEEAFHTITPGGLGAWRQSDGGVKIYKYLKQVTNLTAPAAFRALVHYRWTDGKGRVIRRAVRHTPICREPVEVPKTAGSQPITKTASSQPVRHTTPTPESAQTP